MLNVQLVFVWWDRFNKSVCIIKRTLSLSYWYALYIDHHWKVILDFSKVKNGGFWFLTPYSEVMLSYERLTTVCCQYSIRINASYRWNLLAMSGWYIFNGEFHFRRFLYIGGNSKQNWRRNLQDWSWFALGVKCIFTVCWIVDIFWLYLVT